MARILFIRGGALGDFLLTLPAISLAVNELPLAEIEILGYKPHVDLAKYFGLTIHTRSMEHRPMSQLFIPQRGETAEWREWFASFSVVVTYLKDEDGIFEENLRLCGVKTLLKGPHRIVEHSSLHAANQIAAPLESLGLYLSQPWFESNRRDTSRTSPDFRIALHPGSGGISKNWAVTNWAELGCSLLKHFPNASLLLITGEVEQEKGTTKSIKEAWQNLPHEHADSLSLYEVAALLEPCDFFLGHDSGISHLASACGVPSLLIFGPTQPAVWAPQNPQTTIIQAPMGDLNNLSVHDVLIAAQSRWEKMKYERVAYNRKSRMPLLGYRTGTNCG